MSMSAIVAKLYHTADGGGGGAVKREVQQGELVDPRPELRGAHTRRKDGQRFCVARFVGAERDLSVRAGGGRPIEIVVEEDPSLGAGDVPGHEPLEAVPDTSRAHVTPDGSHAGRESGRGERI